MGTETNIHVLLMSRDTTFPFSPIALKLRRNGEDLLDLADNSFNSDEEDIHDNPFDSSEKKRPDRSPSIDVFPDSVYLAYTGIMERETYVIKGSLNSIQDLWNSYIDDDGTSVFSHIVIGIAPYGSAACFLCGKKKSVIVMWEKAGEVIKDTTDFCENYLQLYKPHGMIVLSENGYPPRDLYENYMKQYCYRYSVMFEEWDEEGKRDSDGELLHWRKYTEEDESGGNLPVFDYLNEALSDGTHDKLNDGGLMKYHEAGKPDKLAIRWYVGKSEYYAYFWFDSMKICGIYEKFYGAHRDVRSDFFIRIDVFKNKYELSLYRYGLRQPVLIPEDAYQLLVFKNNFESFRSENYSQLRGAWIW